MATLKDRTHTVTPPGGWRYVQPETGVQFATRSWQSLVSEVREHREYKGIPVETVELDIERQICMRDTGGQCIPEPGEDYRPVADLTARLTTSMAVSLTKGVATFLAGGAQWVDKAEAERRAAICRGCPFNKPASLCSCSSVYKLLDSLVPSERHLQGVSVCMACGCTLQAKANMPIEAVQASLPPGITLPPFCWQKDSRQPLAAS